MAQYLSDWAGRIKGAYSAASSKAATAYVWQAYGQAKRLAAFDVQQSYCAQAHQPVSHPRAPKLFSGDTCCRIYLGPFPQASRQFNEGSRLLSVASHSH